MNFAYLSAQEYRHIVRIIGNDIPGDRKVSVGLTKIRGIGYNFAAAILDTLKIDPHTSIGFLTESQVEAIEELLKDPLTKNFPKWFVNRRKDIETGNDIHLLTSDIEFNVRNDIEREKASFSWRGYRHTYGLKVRGQRTRTTGRKGGAVGVAKAGKAMPGAAPAAGAAAPAAGAAAPAAGAAAPAAGAAEAKPAAGGAKPAAGGAKPAAGGAKPAAEKKPEGKEKK